MKKLQTILLTGVFALAGTAIANAQGEGYNRVAISYDNTHFGFNKEAGSSDENFSTNGVGINYIHGFSVSSTLPMFVETGLNFNFGFGSKSYKKSEYGGTWYQDKTKAQFINIQVPVNFAYRFNITDDVTISPYLGLNLKLNLAGKLRYDTDSNDPDKKEKGKWESVYDKKNWDPTWNRFQMGWHIGAGVQYRPFYFGIQYGTDFIGAYKHKDAKISTGNLKISLGYYF